MRGRSRGDRGAALVEFALVMPVLVMLMLGIITAGLALNQKQQITHATREGARYAAAVGANQTFVSGTWASNVRDLVVERSAGDLTASGVCVALVQGTPATVVSPANTYSTTGAPCIPGQIYPVTSNDAGLRVQVTGTRDFSIDLGVLPSINKTMVAKATAKSELPL